MHSVKSRRSTAGESSRAYVAVFVAAPRSITSEENRRHLKICSFRGFSGLKKGLKDNSGTGRKGFGAFKRDAAEVN